MKTKYHVFSEVVTVENRKARYWVSGTGDTAKFHEADLGFWMVLADSHEAIFMGMTEPAFHKGDKVKITFERIG